MTNKEIKICPYCKNEMRAMDEHGIRITNGSQDLKFLSVTCQLTRYYYIEPIDQK